jgi:KaiC/GvpD/RAD55 family RecA-like ATPase
MTHYVEQPVYKYNAEIQRILLSTFVADPDLFAKTCTIIKPQYFNEQFRPAVRFVLDYAEKFRALPTIELIQAASGVELHRFTPAERAVSVEWFRAECEEFCRHRAMEIAMVEGMTLLQNGRGEEAVANMREASAIRLMADLGTDYFADPEARLRNMVDHMVTVPTGWKLLDDKLFGGFSKGALNIFLANSGVGKSLVLQNLALNWAFMGYNVIYFTLELAEDHTALKMDAMTTGMGTRDIVRKISDAALAVKMKFNHGKRGRLHIKKYPEGGTCCNDFRAYIKEYAITFGHKPDAVIIDYLDLCSPNNKAIDISNLFIKDKCVSEEIRALMHETDTFGATASQMNRGAIEAQGQFDQSHVAGGISKINTADNAIGLYAPASHKERGDFDFQFLKCRTSSALHQVVRLGYNPETMKISDPEKTARTVEAPATFVQLRKEIADKTKAELPVKVSTDDETSERPETSDVFMGRMRNLMPGQANRKTE